MTLDFLGNSRHWHGSIQTITESLRYFTEHYSDHPLTDEQQEILNWGGHTLQTIGVKGFDPDFQTPAMLQTHIDRLARLCDLMVSLYAQDAQLGPGIDPVYKMAEFTIMARVRLAGLPRKKEMEDMVDYRFFPTTSLYRQINDHIDSTGGNISMRLIQQAASKGSTSRVQ